MNIKMDQANKAYENGDFKAAISLYQEKLNENPKDISIRYKLTDSFIRIGDYDSALQIAQKTLEIEPDSAVVQFDLAYIYFMQKRLDESEAYARKVIQDSPDSPKANELLGCILMYKNDKTSIQYLQKAVELDNRSWYKHYLLGVAYSKNDFPRDAYKEFLEAYKLYPSVKTFMNLANLWFFNNWIWLSVLVGIMWILAQVYKSIILIIVIFLLFMFGGLMNFYLDHKKRGYFLVGLGFFALLVYFFNH